MIQRKEIRIEYNFCTLSHSVSKLLLCFQHGRWNDDPCQRADNSYVCEKAKEELEPAPTPTPDPGCGQVSLHYAIHLLYPPLSMDVTMAL